MDIVSALVTHPQSPQLIDPCVGPLHYPAVWAEPLLRFDSGSSNPGSDAAAAQAQTVLARSVGLVRMQFVGSMPGTTLGCFKSGTASSRGNSSWVSCTLAPVKLSASGRP